MIEYLHQLLSLNVRREDRGASAVEYGLLIAGVAAVIAVAVFSLGGTISGMFDHTSNCVGDSTQCGPAAPDAENP